MRRLMSGIVGLVLTAGVASAQAPFADVPTTHWAYDAIRQLAERGLIIGFPDSTFKGKQPLTRYEFAVVLARMLPQIEAYVNSKVDTALAGIPARTLPDDLVVKGDLPKLATQEDLDALRRLLEDFRPELNQLGVDVDGLKKRLAALDARVTAIEDEVGRFRITGTLDAIGRMSAMDRDTLALDNGNGNGGGGDENGYSGVTMIDSDGRPLNRTNNLLEDISVLYNLNLGISGRVTRDIRVNSILTVGNYGSWAAAPAVGDALPFNRDIFPYGKMNSGSMAASFGVYKAYAEADFLGGKVEAGRTGVQFTPLTLKMVDYDSYTHLPFLDNGDIIFNGVKADYDFGSVNVLAYAGTHGTSLYVGATESGGYNPTQGGYPMLFSGGVYTPSAPFAYDKNGTIIETPPEELFQELPYIVAPATQSAGIRGSVRLPWEGSIGASFIQAGINNSYLYGLGSDVDSGDVGSANVWGADFSIRPLKWLSFAGEYANSNLYERGTNWTVDSNDAMIEDSGLTNAWNAGIGLNYKGIGLTARYESIQPFFGAPGSWGHIGTWKNPTNIEGYRGDLTWKVAKAVTIGGYYAEYDSIVSGNGEDPLAEDNLADIRTWGATVGFGTTFGLFDLGLDWIGTKPGELNNPGRYRADETLMHLGYEYGVTENSVLRLEYEMIDYQDNAADYEYYGNDANGSVLAVQYSVKF